MVRAVLDTNVLLSAAINGEGIPGRLVRAARNSAFDLLASEPLIEEFGRKARQARIVRKYPHVILEVDRVEEYLRMKSIGNPKRLSEQVVPEDPDDNIVFECAVEGGADLIVTGDEHMLRVRGFGPVRILSPRDFANLIGLETT